MKKRSNRVLAVLLSVILALTLAVPAFAGTRQEQVALVLGENALALDNEFSTAYYYFTPEESGKYIIRSVSTPPSDPYMEYNLASYLDYGGTKDFYCVATLTAGVAAEFLIRDTVENSSVTVVVEKYTEPLPNPLSLGDNALSLNRKAYAEEYSFTPAESGVYEFSSSGYGQPGCLWGDEDIEGGMMIGDVYSWQFSFEKELTAGTGYVFKPYNTSGAYEGIVTITKKAAATVELDALALSFGSDPALLHTVGSASVELPADSHCAAEWTWTDQFGNELADDVVFRCGSYFLSLVVTPDSGYQFADNADVTFAALENTVEHTLTVSGRSVVADGWFRFGSESGHSYTDWEEMTRAQVNEAGLGEPYGAGLWEYRVCTVCEKPQYRGGDTPEICTITLLLSNAPAANLTADDVTVAVPADRPYYLAPAAAGADPDYPGWIGTLGEGRRFLCRSEYTGFCVLYPTEGHYFTRDGNLEIEIEVTPADAVLATDYAFISGSEAVYISADFRETDHIYRAPVWSWAEDYSEAYADFACVYGDWTVRATVHNPVMSEVSPATYTQDRIVKFTAHTVFRDEQYEKESGNITVTGSAAALLAADTETFNAYKAEKAAELDVLAEAGDSTACQSLIANAKAEINALAFDTSKSLDENKATVDTEKGAIETILSQSLAMQRAEEALATDKEAFEVYKAEKAAALDSLAEAGDSATSQALIAGAKAAVTGFVFDESKSLDENKAIVDAKATAVTAKLTADLEAQRASEAETPQPEKPGDQGEDGSSGDGGNFFTRLWNRIRDFFARIAAFFRNLFRR